MAVELPERPPGVPAGDPAVPAGGAAVPAIIPARVPARNPVGDDYQACHEYARSQLDDIEIHVQAIIERMLIRLPSLRDVSEALRTEMINWLRDLSRAVMNVLATDTDFEVLSPMIEAAARRRKSLGIDQTQTMNSSRYGQQALIDHAREFFRGHPQEAEMVGQMMSRLMEFQHVMTLSVARGYAAAASADEVSDRQAKLQLLLDLLCGQHAGANAPDPNELALGLGIQLPFAMVTVSAAIGETDTLQTGNGQTGNGQTGNGQTGNGQAGTSEPASGESGPGETTIGETATDVSRSIARMNHWAVVGVSGDRVVALTMRTPNVFPAPSGTAILPDSVQSEPIAAALARARVAADVAQRLLIPAMTAVDAAPFAALLALPAEEQRAYVESCFGDLPSTARGRSLLSAVSASLTHARLADAALVLHVHRHTLDYRLRRFSDQTGLDLGDPAERLRCTLGLFLIGMLPVPALT